MDLKLIHNEMRLLRGDTAGWKIDAFGDIRDEFGRKSGFDTFGGGNSKLMRDPYCIISKRPLLLKERTLL